MGRRAAPRPGARRCRRCARTRAAPAAIREGGFTYTLAPGEYGRDAIDEFWLDRKGRFCEHFAAAFVVADARARRAGAHRHRLPGRRSAAGGRLLDRAPERRARLEPNSGRPAAAGAARPTAVAPDRIQRSLRLAPPPGLVAGTINAVSPQLMAERLARSLGGHRQPLEPVGAQLFARPTVPPARDLGVEAPDWQTLATLLVTALHAGAHRRRPGGDRHRRIPDAPARRCSPRCAVSA